MSNAYSKDNYPAPMVIKVTNPITGGVRIFKDEDEMHKTIGRSLDCLKFDPDYIVEITPYPESVIKY